MACLLQAASKIGHFAATDIDRPSSGRDQTLSKGSPYMVAKSSRYQGVLYLQKGSATLYNRDEKKPTAVIKVNAGDTVAVFTNASIKVDEEARDRCCKTDGWTEDTADLAQAIDSENTVDNKRIVEKDGKAVAEFSEINGKSHC